jgi:hypothetical protein
MSFQVVSQGCKATSDGGRAFTTYAPNCSQDLEIRRRYGLDNNTAYRLFLQRNANVVMEHNNRVAKDSSNTYCQCDTRGSNTMFEMNQKVPGNYMEYNTNY